MFIQNIQVFNNQNRPQYNSQPKNISFEARKLKLSKEVVLSTEQVEQLSFIADIYKKAIDFSAKLNGPYRYKFKECFPNLLAGEKRKGFIFEGLLPNKDRRLQIAKLDARSQEEVISLRIVDNEYKDLLTCRVNKNGKALISADSEYTPVWKQNPFSSKTELNYDGFLSKLYVSFLNLRTYSDNFIVISRQLKSNMNEKTVSEAISHIQTVQISKGLKSELDNLTHNYSNLDELLKIGRSTNAAMYKRMYFGDDYDCARGLLFKNIGQNGETYLCCPAKSKEDDRVLRLVVSDADGKTINGFVFFADGRVMKQVSVEGIKAEDFRIQNLRALSDTEIKNLKLRETMELVDHNITAFKNFVAERVQAKRDRKAEIQVELAQKAQRREQREARKIEEAIAQQKEVRRVQRETKRQEKEAARLQREQTRRVSQEERMAENLRIQQEKAKAKLEERRKREAARELAKKQQKQLPAKPQKVETPPKANAEIIHGLLSEKSLKPNVRVKKPKKQTMNAAELRFIRRKEAEEKRFSTIPKQIREEIAKSVNEVGQMPSYRAIPYTSCSNFLDCNLTKLVESIDTLFATPVEMRSPHLIHGRLSDGRVFGAKVSILASDGANVTITRMKSTTYTDFSYYSVSVVKDGQKYVVNIDPDFMRILESVNGKPYVDKKSMVKHISKQELVDTIPEAENLPRYFDEFFTLKEDAQRVIVESDLKLRETKRLKNKHLLAQKEQEVLKALGEEDLWV